MFLCRSSRYFWNGICTLSRSIVILLYYFLSFF
nr:MAG TPA: hypothetical protein [Caudoviricetes sp.]